MEDENLRHVVILLLAGWSALAFTPRAAGRRGFRRKRRRGGCRSPTGLEVRLVAAEPMVRQPVAIEFDDRGRLWVIQYLQYPNPAGLKRVAVDRYSRTAYDRIPEPPPRGPRGADRITILEDADGDGRADRAHDFVTGLNLASGLAFGYGGVFVLQAPYLLFYPDRDRDDRPDGDPEVLLTGFGMEDAHSVANSLTWGPDGWLYGLQGSTVTARVRGIEFQQGVWRYHPRTRRFELFCEGGGNMWGLDFDRHGQLFASTNVGGFVMLHGVQGGYYWKSFGKHGPLHNPYTFGYFDHVRHDGVSGGHVVGGRPVLRGRCAAAGLAGPLHRRRPARSFDPRTRGRAARLDLPGPSGGRRPAGQRHLVRPQRPDAGTRRRPLRHRLARPADGAPRSRRRLGPDQRADLRHHRARSEAGPARDRGPDDPDGRRARRPARSPQRLVSAQGASPAGRAARRRAWPTACAGPRWRAAGSRRSRRCGPGTAASGSTRARSSGCSSTPTRTSAPGASACSGTSRRFLAAGGAAGRAGRIASPTSTVRAQLACTARRLDPGPGLDVAHRLLARDLDGDDPHIPLLLWWAVEQHAIAGREHALALFTSPAAWRSGDGPVVDPGPAGAPVCPGGGCGGR